MLNELEHECAVSVESHVPRPSDCQDRDPSLNLQFAPYFVDAPYRPAGSGFVLTGISNALTEPAQEPASTPQHSAAPATGRAQEPRPIAAKVAGPEGELHELPYRDRRDAKFILEPQRKRAWIGISPYAARFTAIPEPGDRASRAAIEESAFVKLTDIEARHLLIRDEISDLLPMRG